MRYWRNPLLLCNTLPLSLEAYSEETSVFFPQSEASLWDTFAFWNWGAEDKIDEFRKKRAARQRLPGEKAGPRIRNREMSTKGLLKERD